MFYIEQNFRMHFRVFIWLFLISFSSLRGQESVDTTKQLPNFDLINPTFLGNWQRNYYGNEAPDSLKIIWKKYLGSGVTVISRKLGSRVWAGAGWTGQPLLVKEDSTLYIIQGAYDHNLKKIEASSGKIIWQYRFDDVIKGTGTIWNNEKSDEIKNRLVILQGSRLGVGNYLDSKHIPSYRAISYFTGEELWRLDVRWTDSYSRDVDASALILGDTAYIGLENSLFTKFSPDYKKADTIDNMLQPYIYQELYLYNTEDVISHKNNVVTESSPCIIDSIIYVASGSGHVFGYHIGKKELVWDYFIGSDIDGSAVVTSDSCLLVSVEKQYIQGSGGIFKLNPKKKPDEAVVWYFPTENKEYADWEGGVIGSVGINDLYITGDMPYLAAFTSVDGNLYVVNHKETEPGKLKYGPDSVHKYPVPKLVFKEYMGPSISTPLIVNDKIVAAGYHGIFLYKFDKDLNFVRSDEFYTEFEATPFVYNGKIYVASRDGYFYCLGNGI